MRNTQRVSRSYHIQQLQDRDAFFIYENCTEEEKKDIMEDGMEEERKLSGVDHRSVLEPLERWEGLLRYIDLAKVASSADKRRIQQCRAKYEVSRT